MNKDITLVDESPRKKVKQHINSNNKDKKETKKDENTNSVLIKFKNIKSLVNDNELTNDYLFDDNVENDIMDSDIIDDNDEFRDNNDFSDNNDIDIDIDIDIDETFMDKDDYSLLDTLKNIDVLTKNKKITQYISDTEHKIKQYKKFIEQHTYFWRILHKKLRKTNEQIEKKKREKERLKEREEKKKLREENKLNNVQNKDKNYKNYKNDKNDNNYTKNTTNINNQFFSKDSNKSDNILFKNAWETLKNYELPNQDKFTILSLHPGHFVCQGWKAGSLRNAHWLVKDNDNNSEYYIMNCGNNYYTYFSKEDYNDVINPVNNIYPTWSKANNGYIDTHSYISPGNRIYLHQVICKKHNIKAYSTLSVDHINRNKLDNRKDNLRFATQSEQNQNTDKRNRKHNAKPLPDGLKQEDMPKYVLFYSEKYGKDKQNVRYWFNIEKHPKLNGKKWSTTKSSLKTLEEKLIEAKNKLNELNNN